MIVKNEAHIIQRSLRSIRPFIDCYSISDTGSTDATMEIIREELGDLPGVLRRDDWVDFATNRNLAMANCTATHIVFLDADDVVHSTTRNLVLPPEYDGFTVRIEMPSMDSWATGIIRNDPRWSWKHKLHESLYFDGTPRIQKLETLWAKTISDSHRNQSGEKLLRDLEILETEPLLTRRIFYQAQTLMELGRHEEALAKYLERAEMGGWPEEIYVSLWRAAELMYKTDATPAAVEAALKKAYWFRPSRLEALVVLCELLNKHNAYEASYRHSLVEPRPSQDALFVVKDAEWRLLEEHAIAAFHLGKLDEARAYNLRVLTYNLLPIDRRRITEALNLCGLVIP